MHSRQRREGVSAILTVLYDQLELKKIKSAKAFKLKEIRAKESFLKSMKVFPFSFFFKLLKFIIISFHLALIHFVLRKKIVFIYFVHIYLYDLNTW